MVKVLLPIERYTSDAYCHIFTVHLRNRTICKLATLCSFLRQIILFADFVSCCFLYVSMTRFYGTAKTKLQRFF